MYNTPTPASSITSMQRVQTFVERPVCAAPTGASGHLLMWANIWPSSGPRPSRLSGEGWDTYERESHHHGHAGVAQDLPLIAEEQSENGAAFRISGLSPEPVAEFSIEDSPTDPVTAVFFSGRNLAKSYIFVSRRDYSEAQSVQIANSGFFEQLTEWVLAQNDRHHLPRLDGRAKRCAFQ